MDKAIEIFIGTCDEMMIAEEGLIDRARLRVSKVKLKDGLEKYDGASTGLTYKGAPVELHNTLTELKNPQQEPLIKSTIKKIMLIVDKSFKKEYDRIVGELVESAKDWGMPVSNKTEMESLMKLDLVTVFYSFSSLVDGLKKYPLSSSMDKETYQKENKERTIKLNEFRSNYENESINSATVTLWYNNHGNDNFFGGHTLEINFHIKDGKVVDVSDQLEG